MQKKVFIIFFSPIKIKNCQFLIQNYKMLYAQDFKNRWADFHEIQSVDVSRPLVVHCIFVFKSDCKMQNGGHLNFFLIF